MKEQIHQNQQRAWEQQGADNAGVQGYLLSTVAIAGTGAPAGGQLPSAGTPVLAANYRTEALVLLDGPSIPSLPNPFPGPHINW